MYPAIALGFAMLWMWALMLGCAVETTVDEQTLHQVDAAFCQLATDCWGFYDTVGQCMRDNAVAQRECVSAPSSVMQRCAMELAHQADTCPALTDFAYPSDCAAFCTP